jgi:hypothetical protein
MEYNDEYLLDLADQIKPDFENIKSTDSLRAYKCKLKNYVDVIGELKVTSDQTSNLTTFEYTMIEQQSLIAKDVFIPLISYAYNFLKCVIFTRKLIIIIKNPLTLNSICFSFFSKSTGWKKWIQDYSYTKQFNINLSMIQ